MQGFPEHENQNYQPPNRKTIVLENFPKTGIKHLQSAKPRPEFLFKKKKTKKQRPGGRTHKK